MEHYVNNAVLTHFQGKFYCMWQASEKDEDSPDTHVMYSRSKNGRDWESPMLLAAADSTAFCSAGGWGIAGDTLVAFINRISDIALGGTAWYCTSTDGLRWQGMKTVTMADGRPMEGILEQDPHRFGSRLVGAAHFRPGLRLRPIYTQDLSGRGGWQFGQIEMEDRGNQSRGLEPSFYQRKDGSIVMLMRDQASSFRKLASVSHDAGESWSKPELTDLLDSRSKQCAGNLPDGTAFTIGNPLPGKDRRVLSIAFSPDGNAFGPWKTLRDSAELAPQKYPGRYKTIGYNYPKAIVHDASIYVSYSENKERIIVTSFSCHR